MAGTEKKIMTITPGIPASGKTFWPRQAGFDRMICPDDRREKLWEGRIQAAYFFGES